MMAASPDQLLNIERIFAGVSLVTQSRSEPHPFHEAVYVGAGPYAAELSGERIEVSPGSCIVYPRGVEHRAVFPVDGTSTLTILQWDGACPPAAATVYPDAQGRLANLLDWMLERAGGETADRDDPVAARLLATFVVALTDWNRQPPQGDAPIAALIGEMRRSLDLSISLDYCCKHTGLGTSQLTRRFKAVTGRTPLRYLQDLRLERAHHLLCTTALDMRDIAARVGYRDPGHLGRLLHRRYGRTVHAIRREGR